MSEHTELDLCRGGKGTYRNTRLAPVSCISQLADCMLANTYASEGMQSSETRIYEVLQKHDTSSRSVFFSEKSISFIPANIQRARKKKLISPTPVFISDTAAFFSFCRSLVDEFSREK